MVPIFEWCLYQVASYSVASIYHYKVYGTLTESSIPFIVIVFVSVRVDEILV